MDEATGYVVVTIVELNQHLKPAPNNNKSIWCAYCKLGKPSCPFYVRIALTKNGPFTLTQYTPHTCPITTHENSKQARSTNVSFAVEDRVF